MHHEEDLTKAVLLVVHEIREFRTLKHTELEWLKSHADFATKQDLKEMENRIMSAISDYAAKVDAKFDDIGASVDELTNAVAGVSGDVAGLKSIIDKINTNPGPITPEDQKLLDDGIAKVTAVADRLRSVTDALKALDAATDAAPTPPA